MCSSMSNSIKKLLYFVVLLATISIIWTSNEPPRNTGEEPLSEQSDVKIGGDFALADQNGKMVREADYRGRVMLVFFGFTHCPDICPVTIATLSNVMDSLGADGDKVAPIFITVDPARDTPAVMKNYLANFNPRIVGLTGTPEEIKTAADAYKAYYAQSDSMNVGAVPGDADATPEEDEGHEHQHMDMEDDPEMTTDEEYNVDHSGFIYMMGKNGKYIRHFPYNVSEKELSDSLREYLKN